MKKIIIIVILSYSPNIIFGQGFITDKPKAIVYNQLYFPNKLDTLENGISTVYLHESDSLIKISEGVYTFDRVISSNPEIPKYWLYEKAVYVDKHLLLIITFHSDSSSTYHYMSNGTSVFSSIYNSSNIIKEEHFKNFVKYYDDNGNLIKTNYYSNSKILSCPDSTYIFDRYDVYVIQSKEYFIDCLKVKTLYFNKKENVWTEEKK